MSHTAWNSEVKSITVLLKNVEPVSILSKQLSEVNKQLSEHLRRKATFIDIYQSIYHFRIPLNAGHFNRDVYLEAIERR